jgi:hypothetical protein
MCGSKAGSPVIRLDLVLVRNELVIALGWEVHGAEDDTEGNEEEDDPRGSDEVKARVELPAIPEARVVVVEGGLGVLVSR